jgi:hypothetical protein
MKSRASYPKLIQLLDKHQGDPAVKVAVMKAIDILAGDENSGAPGSQPAAGPDKPAKSGK